MTATGTLTNDTLTIDRIRRADRLRGDGRFRKTPLHHPATMSSRLPGDAPVHLKLEVFQRTGSFKVRGAAAKVFAMSERERRNGIVAASAGNHAQGVALAGAAVGARTRIVMPEYAPLTKREATEGYGAQVILHGATYDEAFAHAVEICEAEGDTLVHAFDDVDVMAGQGTIGLEILQDLPETGTIVCPVGGGGLIAGIAVAVKSLRPGIRVIGVQAEGASSAVDSFHSGRRTATKNVDTIADGIKVMKVGERCFDVMRRYVDEMVTVSDVDICRAVLMLNEHAHVSAEAAGAVGVAALASGVIRPANGPTVAIISGGNIDTFEKTRYIRRALAEERRHLRIRVRLADRRGSKPRQMASLFAVLAEHELNILNIAYRRDTLDLPVGIVEVELMLETRGPAYAHRLQASLQRSGFDVS